jgi:membrane-bound metal-dependent hydrolase YbcI (DUF457 family)
MPPRLAAKAQAILLASFVLLANLPDLPLPYWGHDRHDISHSLFLTLAMIAVLTVSMRRFKDRMPLIASPQVLAGGAAAWLSHLLLDSFYRRESGTAIFWPFFPQAKFSLPLPWFESALPPLWSWRTARICLVEFAFYSTLLAAVVILRWYYYRRKCV